jgi:tetratricopeptide (TPR) repeat protein
MSEALQISHQELDDLFEKYRRSPDSYVFVPLADAIRKIGRVSEALEICEMGLTHHPDYASGHVVRGKCLYDLERDGDATEAFTDVLRTDPHNLVALKYLGTIDAREGRFESARGRFTHILRLDPDNREIKRILSENAEKIDTEGMSRPNEVDEPGLHGAAAVTGSGPETSEELATITLADIFLSQGYQEKALRIYEEVLGRQPDNEVVKRRLAFLRTGASAGSARGADDRVDAERTAEMDAGFEEIDAEPSTTDPSRRTRKTEKSRKARMAPPEPEVPEQAPTRKPIDEKEDIEHFKSWLGRFR